MIRKPGGGGQLSWHACLGLVPHCWTFDHHSDQAAASYPGLPVLSTCVHQKNREDLVDFGDVMDVVCVDAINDYSFQCASPKSTRPSRFFSCTRPGYEANQAALLTNHSASLHRKFLRAEWQSRENMEHWRAILLVLLQINLLNFVIETRSSSTIVCHNNDAESSRVNSGPWLWQPVLYESVSRVWSLFCIYQK